MLNDDEWGRVSALFHTGPEGNSKEQMYGPALREYERITGFHETNPNVLWDHVLSKYGPPCEKCGNSEHRGPSCAVHVSTLVASDTFLLAGDIGRSPGLSHPLLSALTLCFCLFPAAQQ
jgi:hypothetical protein